MPSPIPDHGWSMTRAGVALVTTADGTITGEQATGLFHRDRRIVSKLQLSVDGEPPAYLNGATVGAAADRLIYGYWAGGPDPQAVIVRERSLQGGYHERLTFHGSQEPVTLHIEIRLEPGTATVYHLDEDTYGLDEVELLGDALWATGAALSGLTVAQDVTIDPGTPTSLSWGVALDVKQPPIRPSTAILTRDPGLQRSVDNSAWSFESLTVSEPHTGLPFVAAGAPHFLALFGRDALSTSVLSMIADPHRALETLEVLAEYQGSVQDQRTLESPGRVLHELRIGEMGVFGLEPGTAYYGSVDATPLFVIAMLECLRWGAPRNRLEQLLPSARSAMAWCRSHTDEFGFIQSVPHEGGITNQNWKDSGDSIVRPDGSVLQEATTPVEVQGYFHDALVGLAELETALGDSNEAEGLLEEAEQLAERFHQHFLVDDPSLVALALDSAGEPIPVRASNAGHLLDSEIIDDDLAAKLSDRLFSDQEFSGWGIRTLAATETAYNPLGYHVGSVWPHDNAVMLRGLARRGFDGYTRLLASSLADLAAASHHQLPELLGGFSREQFPEPVPYPASARPQAWAAAVPYQIVTALLGLQPQIHVNKLRLRPVLNAEERIVVKGLHLGERTISIEASGSDAIVSGDTEGLTIDIES